MIYVHFDGSFSSAGYIFAQKDLNRIWIKFSRNCSSDIVNFMSSLKDFNGSLGHFSNGRFIRHTSVGNPYRCVRVKDNTETLFKILGAKQDVVQQEFFSMFHMCGICKKCKTCCAIAEEYGIYDLVDMCNNDRCDQIAEI